MSRVLGIIGKIALVLGILALVGFIVVAIQIQSMFPQSHAIAAPVVWTSEDISLSPAQPAVRGRLSFGGGTIPEGYLRIGLNAGVPTSTLPGADPGAILSGPAVRLSTTIAGVTSTCLAPCELVLPTQFACSASECTMDVPFTVELDDAEPSIGGATSISIAGGANAGPKAQFGAGFKVELRFDEPTARVAT